MARIFRTDIYDYDTLPTFDDYVIGTDAEDASRTKNYRISDLAALINGTATSFLSLTDTPVSYLGNAGKTVLVNATEDGLEFGVGGGASTFLSLTDSPSTYVGQAGLVPTVNVGETALEFLGYVDLINAQTIAGEKTLSALTRFDNFTRYKIDTPASIQTGYSNFGAGNNGFFFQRTGTGNYATHNIAGLTTDRVYTFQDKSGTVAHLDDISGGGSGVVGFDATTYTNIGTGSETAATIVATTDLSANTGDSFRIRASGTMIGSPSTKSATIKIDLDAGSQGLNISNFISSTYNGTWFIDVLLVRTGATSFVSNSTASYYSTTGPTNGTAPSNSDNGSAITWSGLDATFTIDISASVASTMTVNLFSVEFIPAL